MDKSSYQRSIVCSIYGKICCSGKVESRGSMTLGAEHRSTLLSMNEIGVMLNRQYTEAETAHRRTLQLNEKVLGADPSTLTSMNNLAGVLSDQGKYAEAETMHRWTLQPREKLRC